MVGMRMNDVRLDRPKDLCKPVCACQAGPAEAFPLELNHLNRRCVQLAQQTLANAVRSRRDGDGDDRAGVSALGEAACEVDCDLLRSAEMKPGDDLDNLYDNLLLPTDSAGLTDLGFSPVSSLHDQSTGVVDPMHEDPNSARIEVLVYRTPASRPMPVIIDYTDPARH